MGRPYSLDLGERVVAAVEEAGMSRRHAAARFGVGASTVIVWVRRFRRTGSAAPGKMGGYKPKAISGAHHVWLVQRCREKDFTCAGSSPSSPSVASRSTIGRSGTSFTPRS
jgi:putative transposase